MSTKDAHNRAVRKYAEKNYDRIPVLAPKGEKARWTDAARSLGFIDDKGQVRVSQFVRWCVWEKIGKPQKDC